MQREISGEHPAVRKPVYEEFELFTNGVDFQVRSPARMGVRKFQFASSPITRETLLEDFAETWVASHDHDASVQLRLWYGVDSRDGKGSGAISNRSIGAYRTNFQFPPLGHKDSPSPTGTHPYDDFFFGAFQRDGETTVERDTKTGLFVVEHRVRTAAKITHAAKGKLEMQDAWKAWIDEDKGFMPVRMEYSTGRYVYDNKVLCEEDLKPDRVIELLGVTRTPQGVVYPLRIRTRYYQWNPNSLPVNIPSVDELISGKTYKSDVVLYLTEDLQVISVDHRPIPGDSYAFAFPKGVQYFDDTKQRMNIVGMTPEEYDRMVAQDLGVAAEPTGRSFVRWCVIFGAVAFVLVFLLAVFRRRLRKCS